jgi:hypothetical protein
MGWNSVVQKKSIVLFFSVFFLAVIVLAVYLLLFTSEPMPVDFYRLDETTKQTEKVLRTPSDPTITGADPTQGDGKFLTKVLKGFYSSYDAELQILQLKNQFRGSSYLQELEVEIDGLVGFYCWPENIQQGNKAIETKSMEFYVYPDGKDLVMPNEKFFTLDLISSFLNENRYLVVQLYESFDLQQDNKVQKLILLGC